VGQVKFSVLNGQPELISEDRESILYNVAVTYV
jgi:hypothetical protein